MSEYFDPFIKGGPSIKFFLHMGKGKEGDFPLYCRITLKRKKAEFSLNTMVRQEEWDVQNGRYIAGSKKFQYLNNRLSEVEGKIIRSYHKLSLQKVDITATILKDLYQGKNVGKKDIGLLEFNTQFIAEQLSIAELNPSTIQHYRALKWHLSNFLEAEGREDIPIKDVTRGFISRFDMHLMTFINPVLERSMKRSNCVRILTKLKRLLYTALERELIEKNPFSGIKLRTVPTNKVYLTAEELKMLEGFKPDPPSLKKVKSIFLFGCYTGLRYSDLMSLTEDNIFRGHDGNLWIQIVQQKTDQAVSIPMSPQAVSIYNQYDELRNKTGRVLPHLIGQKLNYHLKVLTELAGIKKPVTAHSSRHTFATLALERGVPLEVVSKLLGHKDLKSTMVYARITRNILSDSVSKLSSLSSGWDGRSDKGDTKVVKMPRKKIS